jgi:hypothetical protein
MPSETVGLEFFNFALDHLGEQLFAAQGPLSEGFAVAIGGCLGLMIAALAFLLIGATRLLKKVRLSLSNEPKIGLASMLMALLTGALIGCGLILFVGLIENTLTALSILFTLTGLAAVIGLYVSGIRFTPVESTS